MNSDAQFVGMPENNPPLPELDSEGKAKALEHQAEAMSSEPRALKREESEEGEDAVNADKERFDPDRVSDQLLMEEIKKYQAEEEWQKEYMSNKYLKDKEQRSISSIDFEENIKTNFNYGTKPHPKASATTSPLNLNNNPDLDDYDS